MQQPSPHPHKPEHTRSPLWLAMSFWGISAPKKEDERHAWVLIAIVGGVVALLTIAAIVGIVLWVSR